ncbi:hypothetical protein [Leucobacter sp. UCD-THU]|uniref:hypothetical protein n=1 Tax=Leucobacter sp. UCD-THU TaxID=1292023 RepID=UPI0003AA36A3|nr:hypothetical protein [Leucobacter sp. UCD-THU]
MASAAGAEGAGEAAVAAVKKPRAAKPRTAKAAAKTATARPAAKAAAKASAAKVKAAVKPAAKSRTVEKAAASSLPAAEPAAAVKKPVALRKRPRKAPVTGPVTIGRSGFTKLKNISEIRHYLRTSDTPVFFVGATAFNLLGLDRWVRGFSFITYYDSWDGNHPRVFTPSEKPYVEFESGEEINNWLLSNHEVRAHIERRTPPGRAPAGRHGVLR